MKEKLTRLRNQFSDSLPTGDVKAWDLLTCIKEHLNRLDNFIDDIPEEEFCKCEDPIRDVGFDYCMFCHKHVEPKRLDIIINKNDDIVLKSEFVDTNVENIKEYLDNRLTKNYTKYPNADNFPEFRFSDINPIPAGYYTFKIDNLVFTHCWIELYEWSIFSGFKEYKSGSYNVIKID